jgi:hypothetical protein
LPGDADLHVDRLLTLLGKVTAVRIIKVGLTDGGRAAACWAGIAPLDENRPRTVFPAMMKSIPGCSVKTGQIDEILKRGINRTFKPSPQN